MSNPFSQLSRVYYNPGKEETPENYLQKELGITIRSLQDNNSILAIKEPAKFLKKRDDLIKAMFVKNAEVKDEEGKIIVPASDGRVTEHYNKRKEELEKLGIPSGKAHQFAVDSARALYEEELKILDYSMPTGYQQAFTTAAIDHNAEVKKADVADFDRAAYKKKLKEKYKQKYKK